MFIEYCLIYGRPCIKKRHTRAPLLGSTSTCRWLVKLEKGKRGVVEPLGVSLSPELVVEDVEEGGLVERYGLSHPDFAVTTIFH